MIKRIFDIIISTILLILSSPFFVLGFLIVLFNDGNPIFFRQQRVGLHGCLFYIYKFRSMKINSEKLGTTTYKNDNRIFYGGNFLRRYKIDELPQLINVLRGEMSLVGPRPTVLDDYQRMNIQQKKRDIVLPGITGLAQISGNTNLKWPERIKKDLYYIKHATILFDIKILYITFFKLLGQNFKSDNPLSNEWE